MAPDPEPRSELHLLAEERLRRAGQRYTSGRRVIVELLGAAGRPVSIGDIADALPEVPRSSAYRHLLDLQTVAVVRKVEAFDEFARFELAEDLTEHHHHLCCTSCGKILDVVATHELEEELARHVERLASQEGFTVQSHRVDVLGLCASCASPRTKQMLR